MTITATLVEVAVRGTLRIEEQTESKFSGIEQGATITSKILAINAGGDLKPTEKHYLEHSKGSPATEPVEGHRLEDKFYTSLPKILQDSDNPGVSRLYQKRPTR